MLHPRSFIALTLAVLAALVGVGFVQGVWTERWPSGDHSQAMSEMEKLPMKIGVWDGMTLKPNAAQQILPDAKNYLRRQYVNQGDGTAATIMLTRGRPGPMVIQHLPTECYPGAGFDLVDGPKSFLTHDKVADEFRVATFKKTTDVLPQTVRVYWSWSGDGQWQTPERPRLAFARYPVLYKLYVIQAIPNENERFEGAPVHDFIKELTGALRGSLFSAASK